MIALCPSSATSTWVAFVAMIDTQNKSIQSLNSEENGLNSIYVNRNSIQTIIEFKKKCYDSTVKIIQFNNHGISNTVWIRYVPKLNKTNGTF